ncbi:hypothetical protein NC651_003856 [Populus alba x Populus x berolinensis]|nr:hypothetical protein NC651_003856 [Populus alba x Populus x berolinensis]
MSFSRLLFASLVAFCLATFASGASRLPDDEGMFKARLDQVIQGSGLSGPIPPGIALLEKMADLRISDLQGNGTEAPFPPSTNMKNLKTLS